MRILKVLAVLIAITIISFAMLTGVTSKAADPVDYYRELVDEMEIIQIYDSADLTMEMLQNRNGKIIIEKCIGIVTDDKGNGKLLNCRNPEYYYISYKEVPNANFGDVIVTYFVYDPSTNIEDDIMERYDIIIDK